jgi:hypothetical protein
LGNYDVTCETDTVAQAEKRRKELRAVIPHNPQPNRRRRRPLAPPEEREKARAVARLVALIDDPNPLVVLSIVGAHFPDIKLSTALAGVVFRELLLTTPEPERVLHIQNPESRREIISRLVRRAMS